ncbi:MAG TPA: hypothetical protein VGM96_29435 [Reyranella sp.]|jgi:hypothetical protein
MHRRLLDYSPEAETYEAISATGVGRANPEAVFNEADEMELAVGLLGITNHADLERFLGGVVEQASRTVGKAVPSAGKGALTGILTAAAKKALPVVDSALEGQPGLAAGTATTTRVIKAAAKYLGLELEGLSPEDQEFEAARQFIRFAADATRNAVGGPVATPAHTAAAQAAHRFAPGLRSSLAGVPTPIEEHAAAEQSGRWVRRGSNIIVVGT